MKHRNFVVGAFVLALLGTDRALGQTPPPRPRLLFTAAELSAIQGRALASGTPAAAAYASMATSVSLTASPSDPLAWTYSREVRRMQEVALRFRITGQASYATSAITALMNLTTGVAPNGSNGPYQLCTYPCAIAITYDLLYDQLTASQRATVVSRLEAWVNAIQSGTNAVGSYSSYGGATDNYSFAWSAGIAMALLAIWGETNRPNLLNDIQTNMIRLQSGWKDGVSPDGSIDESYGYANYGVLWSLRAGIACKNCGLGDYMAGTNVLGTGHWFGRSLMGSEFPWTGDSSPSHKGMRIDPIVYYPIGVTSDSAALFGVERIFALEAYGDNSVTWGFSPWITVLLYYPLNLIPTRPAVASAFFRDNLNVGPATGNKLNNYFGVGEGGHAFLHNESAPGMVPFTVHYTIRDEWMNHAHEDDGGLLAGFNGSQHYIDRGYGGTGAAQSKAHNIVTMVGVSGFGGDSNNYYAPPGTEGRFYGRREASHFGQRLDYVRGDHRTVWTMAQADRTVMMVKDAVTPYMVLVDVVDRDGTTETYEAMFNASSAATGAGTASNPMRVTKNSQSLRAVWLAPSGVTVVPGSAASSAGITYYPNKVRVTGARVGMVSVHGPTAPSSTAALPSPGAGTVGGIANFSGFSDRILARTTGTTVADAVTNSDGRLIWLRESPTGALLEWAVAEAMTLICSPGPVLQSNARVIASARAGRVEITILDGTAPRDLDATLLVPFGPIPASEISINGGPATSILWSGNQLILGTPLTGISSDDRFYTFRTGEFWDAIPTPEICIDSQERLSVKGTTWGSIKLRGGTDYAVRPSSVALTAHFAAGGSSVQGVLKFETQSSLGDVLTVEFGLAAGNPSSFLVTLKPSAAAAPAGTFSVPFGSLPLVGRFELVLDPATGGVEVYEGNGGFIGSVTVNPAAGPFKSRVIVGPGLAVDDITAFDSAEDGVTPRGLAFFGVSNGRSGFAFRAPNVASYTVPELFANGVSLGQRFTQDWIIFGGFQITNLAVAGPANSALVRELTWESRAATIDPSMSAPLRLTISQPGGGMVSSFAWLP